MTRFDDPGLRLYALMNALAEEVALASNAGTDNDTAADGETQRGGAEEIRSLLLGTVQQFKKDRLRTSEERYRKSVEALLIVRQTIPRAPSEQRSMLDKLLSKRAEVRGMVQVTMQHRGFETMSDEDVESMLGQLQHLGLLDAEDDEESEK